MQHLCRREIRAWKGGKGMIDKFFVLNHLINKCTKGPRKHLYAASVEFAAAIDRINCDRL